MKNLIRLWPILCLALLYACSSDDATVESTQPASNNNNDPVAERTLITDSAFEQALIDLGFDDVIDGSILKSSAESVVNLVINELDISYLHVFTYSERANTHAINLENPVPMHVRRERNEMLRILSEKKKRFFYNEHLGSCRKVLFESLSIMFFHFPSHNGGQLTLLTLA